MRGRGLRGRRSFVYLLLLLGTTLIYQTEAYSQSIDQLYELQLEEAERAVALDRLAQTTGLQLISSHEFTRSKMGNSSSGSYTVDDALEIMLRGSRLSGGLTKNGVIVISQNRSGEETMNRVNNRKTILGSLIALVLGADGVVAEDVDAVSTSSNVIEEIIVTANKRTQSLLDIPASISAIGQADLESRGIKDLNDIQFAVPSLHFGELLGEQNIAIRGIGSFARQPGVSVSIDGVYQTRSATAGLYQLDLERVEVLRGPQGTLHGRNSNGGVVNFISADPTSEPEGYIRLGYADFDEVLVQAAYSGPIGDRVSFRIAADQTDRGEGWVKNNVPGSDDLGQGKMSNVRLKVAAEVTDNISVDFMYSGGDRDGPLDHYALFTKNFDLVSATIPQLPGAGSTVEPLEVYATGVNSDLRYELASLTVEWDLGFATLKSITANQDFKDRANQDRDVTNLEIIDSTDDTNIESFTQEFNLVGSSEKLDWVLGAYYLTEDWDRRTIQNLRLPVLGFPLPSTLDFNQSKYETDSISLFVDGTWNISEKMRISAGVRRTEDDISEFHNNTFYIVLPDSTALPVLVACDNPTDEEWGATTIRAGGQYDLTADSTVYLSYSEGYKAGGVGQYECTPAFDPEEVEAYEIGYKASFLGGRTHLSGAVFFYDYVGFQVTQALGIGTATRNAGDAEVRGVEIEFTSSVGENWTINASATLLDSEYKDFINFDGLRPELGFQQLKGNSLSNAPETSINLGFAYSFAQFGGLVTLRADSAYRSRTYFREFNGKDDSQDAYTVVNLNATWESDDQDWTARLFAKNVTDEEYAQTIFGSGASGGRYATWGMSRQVGVEVVRRFGGQ